MLITEISQYAECLYTECRGVISWFEDRQLDNFSQHGTTHVPQRHFFKHLVELKIPGAGILNNVLPLSYDLSYGRNVLD
jgi:hypothetical protein